MHQIVSDSNCGSSETFLEPLRGFLFKLRVKLGRLPQIKIKLFLPIEESNPSPKYNEC